MPQSAQAISLAHSEDTVRITNSKTGEDVTVYFLAGLVALALGSILIAHAVYATRWGHAFNKAEFGGGLIFALFGFGMAFLGYKEKTFVPETTVSVRITPSSPRVGEEARLTWSIIGDATKLRHLRIELQGEESIIRDYKGTDRSVDSTTFATLPLVDEQAPLEPKGMVKFTVPADGKATWMSRDKNPMVDWYVHIEGEREEDTFEDDVPVTILPVFGG
jgi:hypothetical protein